jgi:hypothetical protein
VKKQKENRLNLDLAYNKLPNLPPATEVFESNFKAAKYLKTLESQKILKSQKAWKETLFVNTELFELLRK